MKIIIVDDEKIALDGLVSTVCNVVPGAEVHPFKNAKDALEFAKTEFCEIAFLDIELRDMRGTQLAKALKQYNPQMNIIFATGYDEYANEAFRLHASGYIMKPVTEEMVKQEMEALRFPVPLLDDDKLHVQTFGNFEVFYKGKPLKFQYTKTKEMFAYLIDRNGALCSNGELMAILWEDEASYPAKNSYFKNLRGDMMKTLEEIGYPDIIVKQRGKIGVIPSKIKCDYYDWQEGKAYAINAYRGEYMSQYTWSEFRHKKFE